MSGIQWQQLDDIARDAALKAYVPYSRFPVGSAVLADSGLIYSGCNVENASYGATICAERNAIAAGVRGGEKSFVALLVYTPQEQLTPPCGLCRQVIAEFFSPDCPVVSRNHLGQQRDWTLKQLLPDAFTPGFLVKSAAVKTGF